MLASNADRLLEADGGERRETRGEGGRPHPDPHAEKNHRKPEPPLARNGERAKPAGNAEPNHKPRVSPATARRARRKDERPTTHAETKADAETRADFLLALKAGSRIATQ